MNLYSQNEGNWKVITITPGGERQGYALGVIYTINKDATGLTLTCNTCFHGVSVNQFDNRLGSPRTQAARAMLKPCT